MSVMSSLTDLHRCLKERGHRPLIDEASCRTAARDFAWLSPILTARLGHRTADIVVFPEDGAAVTEVVALAAEHGVPITARGRGTGNYGQSVPLEGGLVIDMTRATAIIAIGDDVVTVAPGATCQAVERAANAVDRELMMFPSTVQSTVGGFAAGGAGGSGSIEHGFLWEGFVHSAVVAFPARPGEHTVTNGGGTEDLSLRPFLHTFGTVGVFTELTVQLEPRRSWTGASVSFPTMAQATEAVRGLLDADLPMRLLGASEASLVGTMPKTTWLDPSRASLRAVVEENALDDAVAITAGSGGRIDGVGASLIAGITRCSYNHVTLHAKRADPSFCHLQIGGLQFPDHANVLAGALPHARLHVDAMRGLNGREMGGLLMSRFVDEATLRHGIECLREAGVVVVDPHTWEVFDPDGSAAAAAEVTDPKRLLNPGKLVRSSSPLIA
jgi:FAD/FMN-containing dehydrogenase